MAPPISNQARQAAMERGDTRFFGEPCAYGHAGEMYTIGYACVECRKAKSKQRLAAAEKGKRFFSGKPCRHGHGTTRYVSNGICIYCSSERSAGQYIKKQKKSTRRQEKKLENINQY